MTDDMNEQIDTISAEPVALPNGQSVALEPEAAKLVREAIAGLADHYGQSLEQYRRQALSTVGTSQPMPTFEPESGGFDIPDPDLLFQSKDTWSKQFEHALDAKLAGVKAEQAAMVREAVGVVQSELERRDQQQTAEQTYNAAWDALFAKRPELAKPAYRTMLQGVLDEEYPRIQHLPLDVALDRVAAITEARVQEFGGGTGGSQTPPSVLRSSRRSGGAAPAAEASPSKTISDLILERQRRHALGAAA